ncbi:MAG TPA: hypothetical protein VMW31_05155 [Devosiaceae bacterium]|nr:hypothetical protein [Devosiaceae bacterium]
MPLGAAALQFPIRHPAICSVLPGPRTPAEFDQIFGWWNATIRPKCGRPCATRA